MLSLVRQINKIAVNWIALDFQNLAEYIILKFQQMYKGAFYEKITFDCRIRYHALFFSAFKQNRSIPLSISASLLTG